MRLKKTSGLGFALDSSDGKHILLFNTYRWGLVFLMPQFAMCIAIIDRIFWRGTLREGLYRFSCRGFKPYKFNLNWRFWVIMGEVCIRSKVM